MRNILISLPIISSLSLVSIAPVYAEPSYQSKAPVAYMVDITSGAVLYDSASNKRMPPASMAKMMTVYVAFEMLKKGELSLDDTFAMPPALYAEWGRKGSTMFIKAGDKVRVDELLNGIITLSGNDACALLATGISGTEAAFATRMNEEARKLGMTGSRFANSMGWPDGGKTYVTARDLGTLARKTIENHPQLYKRFYGVSGFNWNGVTQPNRNPILGKIDGADGLKTGHTDEAGYGFTGSATQNGRRIVMVVAGLPSFDSRISESVSLMKWGFLAWDSKMLFKQGDFVGEAAVQLGDSRYVDLIAPDRLGVALPRGTQPDYALSIRYKGPIKAPIAKGQKVADLIIKTADGEQALPLVAAQAVGEAGPLDRIWNGFMSMFS